MTFDAEDLETPSSGRLELLPDAQLERGEVWYKAFTGPTTLLRWKLELNGEYSGMFWLEPTLIILDGII